VEISGKTKQELAETEKRYTFAVGKANTYLQRKKMLEQKLDDGSEIEE